MSSALGGPILKIALFTDTYPEDINGVARTLGMLVEHASARGHSVALVTPQVSKGAAPYSALHHQLFGIPIPIYRDLQLARGIDREGRAKLEEFAPDLVHVATESTVGLSGRNWAVREGVPLVTSFHTNFPAYLPDYRMGLFEPWVWRYLRWFHSRSRVTLCPSRATREDLEAHDFHDRLRIWSRGVDTRLFDPERRASEVRERLAPGADKILLYVGRIASEKRVDFLLDVFPRIRSQVGDGVALVFVGDGPASDPLRKRAPEGVYFTGFLRGEALADAYAAADLFVFASETETFGNVVLEALASGVPAVAVDRGGVTETVLPGRTGVLVPPRDPVAFAEACVTLLGNEDERLRLADGARSEALSRSWPVILDGVLESYRLSGGSPRPRREDRAGALVTSHSSEGSAQP
ncbi:MAG: glycosyltransferase family 1 protein [Gemmatimonadota bacterium]